MIFLCRVHIHLGNTLYKYGWNHDLHDKVLCIYITGGLCIRRTSKFSFRNSSNQNIKMNIAVVCHKMHYHLN